MVQMVNNPVPRMSRSKINDYMLSCRLVLIL